MSPASVRCPRCGAFGRDVVVVVIVTTRGSANMKISSIHVVAVLVVLKSDGFVGMALVGILVAVASIVVASIAVASTAASTTTTAAPAASTTTAAVTGSIIVLRIGYFKLLSLEDASGWNLYGVLAICVIQCDIKTKIFFQRGGCLD